MLCENCGGEYKMVTETYTMEGSSDTRFIVPTATVENLTFWKCPDCGDVMLSLDAARKIEEVIKAKGGAIRNPHWDGVT